MGISEKSNLLFRRHDALVVFAAVARLGKDEFTNEDVTRLCEVGGSTLSDELTRLLNLGAIERIGRKGRFRRLPTALWQFAEALLDEWRDGMERETS